MARNAPLSIEDFEDLAYFQLIRHKLADHLILPKVPAHFAEHQLDYAQAIIYEVTLPQQELAMELFYSWQEQEQDFLTIVHRYNTDPRQRLQGNYRRVVRRRDLDPELSAIVFAAAPATMLPPLETRQGFQLVYVAEIVPPELTPELEAEICELLFQKWLRRQVRQSKVGPIDLSQAAFAQNCAIMAPS